MAGCLASLGFEIEDLWPRVAPYITTVSMNLDTGMHTCEAVIVADGPEGILMITPGSLPSWQATVDIPVDRMALSFANRVPCRCIFA